MSLAYLSLIEQQAKRFIREKLSPNDPSKFRKQAEYGVLAIPTAQKAVEEGNEYQRTEGYQLLGDIFRFHAVSFDALNWLVQKYRHLAHGEMTQERLAALYALGSSGYPNILITNVPLLMSNNVRAAESACFLFGFAQWTPSLDALTAVAEIAAPAVTISAIWAIGNIGGDEAVEHLVRLRNSGKSLEDIVLALGKCNSIKAMIPLAEICCEVESSHIPDVMHAMLCVIESTQSHDVDLGANLRARVVEACRPFSQDEHAETAFGALSLLGFLGERIDRCDVEASMGFRPKNLFDASSRSSHSNGRIPTLSNLLTRN